MFSRRACKFTRQTIRRLPLPLVIIVDAACVWLVFFIYLFFSNIRKLQWSSFGDVSFVTMYSIYSNYVAENMFDVIRHELFPMSSPSTSSVTYRKIKPVFLKRCWGGEVMINDAIWGSLGVLCTLSLKISTLES